MALYVGLDVSLKTTSICIVAADGSIHWEGKAESEPAFLVKALTRWRAEIALVRIEACPLSEWLYGALVESGFSDRVHSDTARAALPVITAQQDRSQ